MSKNRIPSKAVSEKGKANLKAITQAISSIQFPYMIRADLGNPSGELRGPEALAAQMRNDLDEYYDAAAMMQKSGDAELRELGGDLNCYIGILKLTANTMRGILAKAKSRAEQLEGR